MVINPLAIKLREKWLYQLAQQKNWPVYSKHYQPSMDSNLQCFSHLANFLSRESKRSPGLPLNDVGFSEDSETPICIVQSTGWLIIKT